MVSDVNLHPYSAADAATPSASSVDEIRAKYGRSKPLQSQGSGGVAEVTSSLNETRNKLLERGEKLSSLQDRTAARSGGVRRVQHTPA